MDPNANLREQRDLAAAILDGGHGEVTLRQSGERLAELVVALDDWLTSGGFVPSAWAVQEQGKPRRLAEQAPAGLTRELQPSPCGFCGRLVRWFDQEESAKHENGACRRQPLAEAS